MLVSPTLARVAPSVVAQSRHSREGSSLELATLAPATLLPTLLVCGNAEASQAEESELGASRRLFPHLTVATVPGLVRKVPLPRSQLDFIISLCEACCLPDDLEDATGALLPHGISRNPPAMDTYTPS